MTDGLKPHQSKRDFSLTSEPAEGGEEGQDALTFVIQKAPWLPIKEKDAFARPAGEAPPGAVTAEHPAILQRAFDGSDSMQIVYLLFDAPYLDGYAMRTVPLEARRAARRVPGAARRQAGQRHRARAGRTHAREREK